MLRGFRNGLLRSREANPGLRTKKNLELFGRASLLAPGVVWRSAGFASRIACQNPGEHSLELGTPGLYDGRPLAFKTSSYGI